MSRTKKALIEEAKKELVALFEVEAKGGFAEYTQFCEEFLRENLHFYSKEGLRKLIEDAVETRTQ